MSEASAIPVAQYAIILMQIVEVAGPQPISRKDAWEQFYKATGTSNLTPESLRAIARASHVRRCTAEGNMKKAGEYYLPGEVVKQRKESAKKPGSADKGFFPDLSQHQTGSTSPTIQRKWNKGTTVNEAVAYLKKSTKPMREQTFLAMFHVPEDQKQSFYKQADIVISQGWVRLKKGAPTETDAKEKPEDPNEIYNIEGRTVSLFGRGGNLIAKIKNVFSIKY